MKRSSSLTSPETEDDVIMGILASNFTTGTTYFEIYDGCPDSAGSNCFYDFIWYTWDGADPLLLDDIPEMEVGTTYYIVVSAATFSGCTIDLNIFNHRL